MFSQFYYSLENVLERIINRSIATTTTTIIIVIIIIDNVFFTWESV
jgi:hypothetical protein